MVVLRPIIYSQPSVYGDFGWMIRDLAYSKSLFIFNDNEEQFLAFMAGSAEGLTPGGGNAVIRNYQGVQHSAGIPTGVKGVGYQDLRASKSVIDRSLQRICELLQSRPYDYVFYSAAEDGRTLGSSIFDPSSEVKDYIVRSLEAIVK